MFNIKLFNCLSKRYILPSECFISISRYCMSRATDLVTVVSVYLIACLKVLLDSDKHSGECDKCIQLRRSGEIFVTISKLGIG